MKITVPIIPPSGNVLRRTYRHWANYAKLRDLWENWIWAASGMNKVIEGKAVVIIHVEHARLYDEDNLIAGCKPILDSLKKLYMIHDDSPEYLQLTVTQAKSREHQTTIEVNPA